MKTQIQLKLFASLTRFQQSDDDNFPVEPGTTIRDLLAQRGIPPEEVNLIFINSVKGNLTSVLQGGERVGIFPPIGGG